MYAGNWGYPNNPAGSSPYNGGAPPPGSQSAVMHPGTAPNQMMYNAQQFPMGVQSPAAFPGNPNMMAGVSPAGMMQNTGMPHMAAANGQMSNFQPPYSNPAYGPGVPSSVPPQMNVPPNYMMGAPMPMTGYPVQQSVNQQQQQQHQQQHQQHQQQMMMQRMQASHNMSMPTPQRNFQVQPSQRSSTPSNGLAPQQSQFHGPVNAQIPLQGQPASNAPPTPPSQIQAQTSSSSTNIQTPQTPTFPTHVQGNGSNGTSAGPTPLSPGADPKERERVGILLEINNELLIEAMQIQKTLHNIRNERAAMNGPDRNANDGDKKSTEDEQLGQDYYMHCMRRLQSNLSYLASLADKERKPVQPSQAYPSYLKPPTLNIKFRQGDGSEGKSGIPDREETAKYLAVLYRKLQALFPDIDPNKEPVIRATAQALNSTQSGSQTPGHSSPAPGKQSTPPLATPGPSQLPTAGVSPA